MSLEQHKSDAPSELGFCVLTISDTRDLAADRGGEYLVGAVEAAGHRVVAREIVRDDAQEIRAALDRLVAESGAAFVLATGGTGIAPRDVTYDTVRGWFDSDIPGFGELFRRLSYDEIGSAAILSRATAGVRDGVVVCALPGSPKALKLAWERILLPEAGHLAGQVRRS